MVPGRVGRVVPGDAGVEVEVDGAFVRVGAFVDTRPPPLRLPPPAGERRLLQHFLGWHVRTGEDTFDPEVVGLMDFDVPPGPGVHFRYVLPYGPREALVEETWFGAEAFPPARYRDALAAWLGARAGGWTLVREEAGVLPMTTEHFDPHPSPRVWRVGLAGGAARPATGYAFLTTLTLAEAVARRLLTGSTAPLPALRSVRTELLDGVFLEWLHSTPERAPAAFHRLFERVDPGALVRFLSGRSSPLDELRVVSALAPVAGGTIVDAAMARWGLAERGAAG